MTPKGQHDSDTALPGKCIIRLVSSSEPSIFRSTFQPARTPDPETTPFLARLFKGTVKRDLRCKTWLQRCQSYPTQHRRKSAYFCAANARLSVGHRPYSKCVNGSKQTRVGKQQKHRYEARRHVECNTHAMVFEYFWCFAMARCHSPFRHPIDLHPPTYPFAIFSIRLFVYYNLLHIL